MNLKGFGLMKIIDAHMHFSDVQAFYSAAEEARVEYSYVGLREEAKENGVIAFVCMGLGERSPHAFPDSQTLTPMTANLIEFPPPALFTCLGINPHTLDSAAIERMRLMILADPMVVGFKIFAGYYHFYVHDKIYAPVYKLAAEYGLTVAIHTGVTYSEVGLMEYSHPLTADRLAVEYRDTKFLLCHMGNPWIMDACEVAYKNRNVFLDISGLVEGSPAHIKDVTENNLLMQHYSTGLVYLNNYKKVLFGTDWPIVPYYEYINFCMKLIPEKFYDDVFWKNAVKVYGLKL